MAVIDTLQIVNLLTDAGVDRKAAEAHAEVLKKTVQDELVTKDYLDKKLSESKLEIIGYIVLAVAIIEFISRAI